MKLKYIIAASLLMGSVTSCSDFLEQDNKSSVSASDFYNTEDGFESLTNSMYSTLRTLYNIQPTLWVAGTDLYGDGKTQGVAMNWYTQTSSEGIVLTTYTNLYKSIQLANSVIAYGTSTASKKAAQYTDEARFIRAYDYFLLVQQFGKVSLNQEMYQTAHLNFERTDIKTVYEFIISEFEYLAGSSSNLLERSSAGVGRANKRAAKFFLAKAYLTRGWLNGQDYEAQEENIAQSTDFQNAAKYAVEAINSETPSLSIENAFNINNEDNAEFFWSVQFSSNSLNDPTRDGSYQMAQFGSYLGGAEYAKNKAIDGNESPNLRLMQMYTRGDGRLEQTFMLELHGTRAGKNGYFDYYNDPTGSDIWVYYAPWWATDADIEAWKADDPQGQKSNAIITKTVKTAAEGGIGPSTNEAASWQERRSMDFGVPCIKKFDDYTASSMSNRSSQCSTHDVVVSRLGEAYLIAAEAYLQAGDKTNAAKMINTLRQRPGTIKTGYETAMNVAADDITIDFILDERAREMAGEYVRWTDLKRTHKLVEYFTLYNEDNVPAANMVGGDGKYKILRPFPLDAIDKNQTEVEQNPGY